MKILLTLLVCGLCGCAPGHLHPPLGHRPKPRRPPPLLHFVHGGDPASVKFCHRTGLAYVSCSPFRVPIARLAAAQAALEEKAKAKKK